MAKRICTIDGCEKYRVGRGWCRSHWERWKAHGDPLGGRPGQAFAKAIDHPDGTRTCSKCCERQSLEMFDKVGQLATLGRRSDCKKCRATMMRARYQKNREAEIAKGRARWAAVREARIAADPELYAERARERELISQTWRREDPAGYRRYLRMKSRRRDRGVTRANLRKQYGDECFYCEETMSFEPHRRGTSMRWDLATMDHMEPIALGGTHTWDNVVLACWACNCKKNRTPLDAWLLTQRKADA